MGEVPLYRWEARGPHRRRTPSACQARPRTQTLPAVPTGTCTMPSAATHLGQCCQAYTTVVWPCPGTAQQEAQRVPGETLNPNPQTPKPKPRTPNPQPQTPNPKSQTPNPKPQRGARGVGRRGRARGCRRTSLIRKRLALGTYSRPMPMTLR